MTTVGVRPPKALNAKEMVLALARHFDLYRNLIVPNVCMLGCEMDVAVLSPANYLTEVEVKISLSDWNADRHKTKWQDQNRSRYVNRFFYAVPFDLAGKTPDWVPPEAGLIVVPARGQAAVWREAKKMGADKLPADYRSRMLASTYHRFWAGRSMTIEGELNLDVVLGKS